VRDRECLRKKVVEGKPKLVEAHDTGKGTDSVTIERFNFDIDMLNNLNSGSCVISSTIPEANQQSQKVAVCKEGKTIKIFKIVEEKK
jgi:hypothetical protein